MSFSQFKSFHLASKAIRLITTAKACLKREKKKFYLSVIGHDISNDQLITKQGDTITL